MCEVGARCPTCGQPIDAYETRCITYNGTHTREYECPCGTKTTTVTSELPKDQLSLPVIR